MGVDGVLYCGGCVGWNFCCVLMRLVYGCCGLGGVVVGIMVLCVCYCCGLGCLWFGGYVLYVGCGVLGIVVL